MELTSCKTPQAHGRFAEDLPFMGKDFMGSLHC